MARSDTHDPASPQKHNAGQSLKSLLDRYLICPDEELRRELEQALAAYQTGWIRERAGVAATPAPARTNEPPKPRKPKFPIAAADLDILRRISEGWAATTRDVTRWAWFENRELVTLEPNPNGDGSEILVLTDAGRAAIG